MGLTSPFYMMHQASIIILHFFFIHSLFAQYESLFASTTGTAEVLLEFRRGREQPRTTRRGASRPSARVFEVINLFPCCQVHKAVERAGNGNGGNTDSEMIQLGIQLNKDGVFILNVSTCRSHPAFGTQNVHWACSRCSTGVSHVVTCAFL